MKLSWARYRLALGLSGVLLTSCSALSDKDQSEAAANAQSLGALQRSAPRDLRPRAHPGDKPPAGLALEIAYRGTAARQGAQTDLPTTSEPDAHPVSHREEAPKQRRAKRSRITERAGDTLRVRTTAYCRDEGDHFSFGSMSAIGKPLRLGAVRSAAADWSRFPAGTQFRIAGDDAVYEIDDYGSALVGTETIDLYQANEIAMEEWGVRQVDIEVLRWGVPARSLSILRSRAGRPHIDAMIRGLENSGDRTEKHGNGS